MSAWCLDTMVAAEDRNASRQRNIKQYQEGKSIEDKITEWKRPTGGKVFSAGEVKLGVDILKKVKQNKDKLLEKEKAVKESSRVEYAKLVAEAVKIKDMMVTENKTPKDLKNTELKALLKPLKRDGDAALPTRKKEMIERYDEWKGRTYQEPAPVPLEDETQLVVASVFEEDDNDESESVDSADIHIYSECV